jgi:hypothetical protein
MTERTYEERVAELERIRAERGYVPYHLHRAIMAEPMSNKAFWLVHGGMLALVAIPFLISWIGSLL